MEGRPCLARQRGEPCAGDHVRVSQRTQRQKPVDNRSRMQGRVQTGDKLGPGRGRQAEQRERDVASHRGHSQVSVALQSEPREARFGRSVALSSDQADDGQRPLLCRRIGERTKDLLPKPARGARQENRRCCADRVRAFSYEGDRSQLRRNLLPCAQHFLVQVGLCIHCQTPARSKCSWRGGREKIGHSTGQARAESHGGDGVSTACEEVVVQADCAGW
eukprot:COSAG04_NODE_1532_length_6439_cov_1.468139_8_plen_218_part_01